MHDHALLNVVTVNEQVILQFLAHAEQADLLHREILLLHFLGAQRIEVSLLKLGDRRQVRDFKSLGPKCCAPQLHLRASTYKGVKS